MTIAYLRRSNQPSIRLIVLVGILAALLAIWYFRRPAPPATPPEVSLDNVEKQVAAAIRAARARACNEPRSADAWAYFGKVLLAHSFSTEADVAFQQAAALGPDDPRWPYLRAMAIRDQDRPTYLACLQRAVDLCDQNSPEIITPRLVLAEALLQGGKGSEAERMLDKVAVKEPGNLRLRYNRAVLALSRQDYAAARAFLEPLANHPAVHKKACNQLAQACRALGDTKAATEFARQARHGMPDEPWGDPISSEYTGLNVSSQHRIASGLSLEEQGRVNEATTVLVEAYQDHPSPPTGFALGTNLARRGRYGEAEHVLRKVLAEDANHMPCQFMLGMVYFVQAENQVLAAGEVTEAARLKYTAAADCERKALVIKPDQALAESYLGQALIRLGKPDDGLKHLFTAANIRPDLAATQLPLGRALMQVGRHSEALERLRLAVRLAEPRDPKPYIGLAEALVSLGRNKEAWPLVEQAAGMVPADDRISREAIERLKVASGVQSKR